jgi:hypothetical protein
VAPWLEFLGPRYHTLSTKQRALHDALLATNAASGHVPHNVSPTSLTTVSGGSAKSAGHRREIRPPSRARCTDPQSPRLLLRKRVPPVMVEAQRDLEGGRQRTSRGGARIGANREKSNSGFGCYRRRVKEGTNRSARCRFYRTSPG